MYIACEDATSANDGAAFVSFVFDITETLNLSELKSNRLEKYIVHKFKKQHCNKIKLQVMSNCFSLTVK